MSNLFPYRANRANVMFPETRFFDELMRPFFSNDSLSDGFRVDVRDQGDSYLMEADLPGINKNNVTVNIDDGLLTITAEWNDDKNDDEKKRDGYIINERHYGKMTRSFNVENIAEDGIKAEYTDGVLKLTMPKKEIQKKLARRIEIE